MIELNNILSLFDGISGGQIALNKAGIKYNNYYASEIDKHAIKVTQHNYPNTVQLGDITKLKGMDLPPIDIIFAGSPCQSFSSAGKGAGFDGKSGLFWEFARLLKEIKPKYFLLENVRMKKEWSDVIDKELGVKFICINSASLSAQNRVRYYWSNIPNITQPMDKGVKLSEIIEQDYDGVWVYPRGTNKGGIKEYKGKSPSLTVSSWEHNFLIYKGAAKRTFPRQPTGHPREKRIEVRKDEKANCLTTHPLDCMLSIQGGALRYRDKNCVLETRDDEKANALTLLMRDKSLIAKDGMVRNFTPTEAERLQTVPENYTSILSNHQRFKCLGNGWTVDVIVHILKGLI